MSYALIVLGLLILAALVLADGESPPNEPWPGEGHVVLPDVFESWNLVCDLRPSSHYCHAGQPEDPEAHRGAPCMVEGCPGKLRPRTPDDRLVWTVAT